MTDILEQRRRRLILLLAKASQELVQVERAIARTHARVAAYVPPAGEAPSPEELDIAMAAPVGVVRAWAKEAGVSCGASGRMRHDVRVAYARAFLAGQTSSPAAEAEGVAS